MKAVWNGAVIAQSANTVVVEGNHYFPIDAVNADVLRPSAKTTVCSWKGAASYYSLVVDSSELRRPWAKYCTNWGSQPACNSIIISENPSRVPTLTRS